MGDSFLLLQGGGKLTLQTGTGSLLLQTSFDDAGSAPAWSPSSVSLFDTASDLELGYRFDVLDQSLVYKRSVTPDRASAIRIENNINRDTKRTCSGLVLSGLDAAEFDPWGERLKISVLYPQVPGLSMPLGVFIPANADGQITTAIEKTNVDYHDQTLILRQGRRTTFSLPTGSSLTAALATIAAEVSMVPVVDVSTAICNTPMAWPAGTTRWQIMMDISAALGFYSPYFANDGTLICKAVPDLTSATPDNIYTLDANSRIVKDTIVEPTQSFDAPNVYLVTSTGANNAPVFGSYSVPSSAPHSVANRGYEVVESVSVQGLLTNADCEAAARAMASQQTTFESVEFVAWPDPRHDTFDIVEYDGVKFREQSWVWEIGTPTLMSHSLKRIYS